MPVDVTRNIGRDIERELWCRAGGRCEFHGCNHILYKSPVTQEKINISEKAHIYSFSEKGPRGWGPFKKDKRGLNDSSNLMLLCHACHKKIDAQKDGGRYQADLLHQWKNEHEERIRIVTGVDPSKKSYVIRYGANIGTESSILDNNNVNWALFPEWYPADEKSIGLEMKWEGKDDSAEYWEIEEKNLCQGFERKVRPLIEEGHHFSIFGLAPMPLLIRLGTLFTDKIPAQVYQLRREPKQTWVWESQTIDTNYHIIKPNNVKHPPALIISLSAFIDPKRVISVIGADSSIWTLAIDNPHNDFLNSKGQLSSFRKAARTLFAQIILEHGINTPLSIFPAMPVAAAIEFGRVRMPKADMPWIIYDENIRIGSFIKSLEIGGRHHE